MGEFAGQGTTGKTRYRAPEGVSFRGGIRMAGLGQRRISLRSTSGLQPSTLTEGTERGTVWLMRGGNASRSGSGKLQIFDFACAWVWRIKPFRCLVPIPSTWSSMSAEGMRG
jgi:hypothetical protein